VLLGDFIKTLGDIDPDLPVVFDNGVAPGEFASYRGYYEQITLTQGEEPKRVRDVLRAAQQAVGATMTGYKGGDYVMNEHTPLWASDYGDTGTALTDVAYEGKGIVLVTTDISDYA
jgi:hypothetical protein